MVRTPASQDVADLVRQLGLIPHPEGGWYRETHRSEQVVQSTRHGERAAFTSILFLLESPQVSLLHRIDSEEFWAWHAGSPLHIQVLRQGTPRETIHLGPGGAFQAVVPAGRWFGAELPEGGWSLVGCVVAPGFEFSRFQLADRKALLTRYPLEAETILRLT